jgi:hypothetical protein
MFLSWTILMQQNKNSTVKKRSYLIVIPNCDLSFERHPGFEDHRVGANEPKTQRLVAVAH